MKSVFKIIIVVGMMACLLLGSAQATTITYGDDYANWPGYPQAPYPINPNDQIGTYPTISGASITFDSNILQSIVINITYERGTEKLFINTTWDPASGEIYDQWNFLIDLSGNVFSVATTFTPTDYILVKDSANGGSDSWRVGHPYSIISGDLAYQYGILVTYSGGLLTYNFDPINHPITLGNKFVFGVSEDCGNDVFLTPVPEPISLLLLGVGLIGVAVLRKKMK